jgi:hypothetical protein
MTFPVGSGILRASTEAAPSGGIGRGGHAVNGPTACVTMFQDTFDRAPGFIGSLGCREWISTTNNQPTQLAFTAGKANLTSVKLDFNDDLFMLPIEMLIAYDLTALGTSFILSQYGSNYVKIFGSDNSVEINMMVRFQGVVDHSWGGALRTIRQPVGFNVHQPVYVRLYCDLTSSRVRVWPQSVDEPAEWTSIMTTGEAIGAPALNNAFWAPDQVGHDVFFQGGTFWQAISLYACPGEGWMPILSDNNRENSSTAGTSWNVAYCLPPHGSPDILFGFCVPGPTLTQDQTRSSYDGFGDPPGVGYNLGLSFGQFVSTPGVLNGISQNVRSITYRESWDLLSITLMGEMRALVNNGGLGSFPPQGGFGVSTSWTFTSHNYGVGTPGFTPYFSIGNDKTTVLSPASPIGTAEPPWTSFQFSVPGSELRGAGNRFQWSVHFSGDPDAFAGQFAGWTGGLLLPNTKSIFTQLRALQTRASVAPTGCPFSPSGGAEGITVASAGTPPRVSGSGNPLQNAS